MSSQILPYREPSPSDWRLKKAEYLCFIMTRYLTQGKAMELDATADQAPKATEENIHRC